jgi:4-hydroxy 2-oxovalerate aldolase
MKLNLLDCTLRDGGYINDWRFGNLTIRSVISRLDSAGIDIIECGFLDSRVEYDENRSIYPDIPSICKTLGHCLPNKAELVAMIDFGTFDIERLIPKSETVLDGIRLIFQKENVDPALEYAKRIKEQGYKLYLNLVATYSYSNRELVELVDSINSIEPVGVSIVDTYGIMFGDEMIRCAYLLDDSLNKNITLGYHSHNNINVSDANCITFINLNLQRSIIVDCSVLGMGKNSGNAHTEIIALYCNKKKLREFEAEQILECAVTDIQRFLTKQEWGYNIDNLVTAICECSPSWIKYYSKKGTLSISNIKGILSGLPADKRKLVSYFSQSLAEEKYREFCAKRQLDDEIAREELRQTINGKPLLVLCPGNSLVKFADAVTEFVSKQNPYILSVNFVSDKIHIDAVYIGSNKRYSQISALLGNTDIYRTITSSNVMANGILVPQYVFSYPNLLEQAGVENSAIILLTLLSSLGVHDIAVAGLDGYKMGFNNYFTESASFNNAIADNEPIEQGLRQLVHNHAVTLQWITPSVFDHITGG